jgi:hypothetical protein
VQYSWRGGNKGMHLAYPCVQGVFYGGYYVRNGIFLAPLK